MRKRLLRYLGALIVSMVSTYSGMQRFALADTPAGCSLSDVTAWQMALEDPAEEATPAYRQQVTETFLEKCPGRPEAAEAHRIAGLAAAWDGNAEAAAGHFSQMGHVTDSRTLMMHAAVSFAEGHPATARKARDAAIESWISRLVRYRLADVGVEQVRGGEIIRVRFRVTDPEMQVSHLWIARPDSAAWPAAISVTSERQLNALFRLRAGSTAEALRHVRLYRCRTRRVLARTSEPMTGEDMDAAAMTGLMAYLADPDRPADGALEPCLFDNRILPRIGLSGNLTLQ